MNQRSNRSLDDTETASRSEINSVTGRPRIPATTAEISFSRIACEIEDTRSGEGAATTACAGAGLASWRRIEGEPKFCNERLCFASSDCGVPLRYDSAA